MSGSLENHSNVFPVEILQRSKVGVWPGCMNSVRILGALWDCRGRERALKQWFCSSCVLIVLSWGSCPVCYRKVHIWKFQWYRDILTDFYKFLKELIILLTWDFTDLCSGFVCKQMEIHEPIVSGLARTVEKGSTFLRIISLFLEWMAVPCVLLQNLFYLHLYNFKLKEPKEKELCKI